MAYVFQFACPKCNCLIPVSEATVQSLSSTTPTPPVVISSPVAVCTCGARTGLDPTSHFLVAYSGA